MKTLLFDFDGTLADTVNLSFEVMNELAQKYHFRQLSESDLKRLKQLPARAVLKFLGISALKAPLVMAAGKRKVFARIDEVPCNQALKALLGRLQGACRFGVLSTNSAQNVKRFLTNHQLPPFDFIYADARLSGKARVLKRAIKKQNLEPKNLLYIGDEIRDIVAAKRAGVAVAAVSWGYNTKEVLAAQNPDYLVDDVTGLERAVSHFFSDTIDS